jgi:putative acetyltransferase
MVIGPDFIRMMRPGEEAEVDALLRRAFGGQDEAELVRALRRDGAMLVEAVLPWLDRIGAYAAFSRMTAPEGWACLAPVAVQPEWQRGALWDSKRGSGRKKDWQFGRRLVSALTMPFIEASPRLPSGYPTTLVVLGEPAFYERCGFSRARAARLTSPYPLSHTMIARAGNDAPQETLVYPRAFDAV